MSMAEFQKQGFAVATSIRVSVENPSGPALEYEFRRTFRIGRADDCDIRIDNRYVSREHIEVSCESGDWNIRDLNSSNGIFVAGQPARCLKVTASTAIRLGIRGPCVTFVVEPHSAGQPGSQQPTEAEH